MIGLNLKLKTYYIYIYIYIKYVRRDSCIIGNMPSKYHELYPDAKK